MSAQAVIAAAAAFLAFAAVGGLLWGAGRSRAWRAPAVARQVALTDAIHRELGAAAAPDVRRGWTGGWTVTVALPLYRESIVGAVTRITYDVFRRLDGQDPRRLRLVLLPREGRPWDRARMREGLQPAPRLGRAA